MDGHCGARYWLKKKKNFTKNKNQTEIPISKTDQSGAALFEVEFIAWRLAQSRLPPGGPGEPKPSTLPN